MSVHEERTTFGDRFERFLFVERELSVKATFDNIRNYLICASLFAIAILSTRRLSAPTARFVKHWECKRSWDQAVMDSIAREGCALVTNEVYKGNVESFVRRADAFFAMMPSSSVEIPLADSSPLRSATESEDAEV